MFPFLVGRLLSCLTPGFLITTKVPDIRRQGMTSEAYEEYAAGRNDRLPPTGGKATP